MKSIILEILTWLLYRVSLVYIFSLHHQEGYLVLHLSTGKDQDTESDPARLLSHAKSARGSRTTWIHCITRPGTPGIWSAGGTVYTGARCARPHRHCKTEQQGWQRARSQSITSSRTPLSDILEPKLMLLLSTEIQTVHNPLKYSFFTTLASCVAAKTDQNWQEAHFGFQLVKIHYFALEIWMCWFWGASPKGFS